MLCLHVKGVVDIAAGIGDINMQECTVRSSAVISTKNVTCVCCRSNVRQVPPGQKNRQINWETADRGRARQRREWHSRVRGGDENGEKEMRGAG